MPRNGSGQYNLPYNWNDDKANGIKVLASRMQNQDQDIADALTGSLASDGQTPLTGDLDFNGNKAVDLLNGSDLQDAVTVSQAQTGVLQYYGISSTIPLGTDGLDYEVDATPTLPAYLDGLNFSWVAHIDCIDDPILRAGTLGNLQMIKDDGAGGYVNLVAGDILADRIYYSAYNEAIDPAKILITNPETRNQSFTNITADNVTVNKNLTVDETLTGSVFSTKRSILSQNVATPNTKVDFSLGSSFSPTTNKKFTSIAISKTTGPWSAGNNNGGLDTGSVAPNTTYHTYRIYNPTNNLSDALISTNPLTPTLPLGYTDYERVRGGQFLTDGSGNILPFFSDGVETRFATPIQAFNQSNPGTSAVTRTISAAPLGIEVYLIWQYYHIQGSPGGPSYSIVTSLDQPDIAPSNSLFTTAVDVGAGYASSNLPIKTNTSAQIRTRNSGSNSVTSVVGTIFGWIDPNQ